MNNVKRIIALVVSILVILSVFIIVPFTAFAETDGVFIYVSDNCESIILGLTDESYAGMLNIPSSLGGHPVTQISYSAFENHQGITGVKIPASVEIICSDAFKNCTGIEVLDVEKNNSVYRSAGNCLIHTARKTLILGCKKSIIPTDGSVVIIGENAFYGCTGLKNIYIPNCITSILFDAFYGCSGIETITVDVDNLVYYSAGNCIISEGEVVLGCKNSIIPADDSVYWIGYGAFSGCSELTDIIIPNNIISIGDAAFAECTALKNVTIPDGIAYVGQFAFSDCALEKIKLPNSLYRLEWMTFSGCSSLKSIILPYSITEIDSPAFWNCTNITDVYYTGTEQQRESLEIYDDCLLEAEWHYNYVSCTHSQTESRNTVAATCTENGYTGDTYCVICGEKIAVGELIPVKEHSGKWKILTQPTLTSIGSKQEICMTCGEVLDEAEIPALGVTYDIENAAKNEAENVSVAVSAESNLPQTVAVVAEKAEVTEDSITYEIHLENEGEQIQPDAPVLVKLPIPAGFDKDILNVYRKEADGSKTRMDITVDGDFAYFETDHFSIYEILEKLCGDINKDDKVNNKDLTRLFQYLSKWNVEVNAAALDINGDGKVNNKDLTRLFQYLSKWYVEIF